MRLSGSRPRALLVLVALLSIAPPAEARRQKGERRARTGRKATASHHRRETSEEAQAARVAALNARGAAAVAARDFAGAGRTLSEAYRLQPSAETLFQLGALAAAEGRVAEAQDLLRRYLYEVQGEAETPQQKEAERVLAQRRPPSGEVSIVGERGAFALVDDRLVGVLPLALPLLLSSGPHRIAIERGSQRLEEQLQVAIGRVAEVNFKLGAGVVAVTLPPAILLLPEYQGVEAVQRQILARAAAEATRQASFALLDRDVALTQAPKLAECLGTLPCRLDLARRSEVGHMLALRAEARGARKDEWSIRLSLLEAEEGDVAASVTRSCERCSAAEAGAAIKDALPTLLGEGTKRQRGALKIASVPAGAEVLAGDRKLGLAPLTYKTWAGPLELSLRLRGHEPERAATAVEPGKETTLEVTLRPTAPPALAAPKPLPQLRWVTVPRPRWRLATGAAAAAAGLGLLGLGISALSVTGQCFDAPVDGQCQKLYFTTGVGAGLTAAGAVLAAGGAVLIGLPGGRRQVRAGLAPSLSGAGLRLAGEF